MTGNSVNVSITAPATHLFISPHYDDIALSCGGTAALVANARKDAVIALLFGDHPDPTEPLTPFASEMHRKWRMPAEQVIARRRAEEAESSRVLGVRDIYLPFRDAIYRGANYQNDDELFGPPSSSELELPGLIVAALASAGFRKEETRVYAPLASGFHVDHQLAFRAGELLHHAGWDIWFYEDLPYSLIDGALTDRISHIEERLKIAAIVDVSSVWHQKIDAIMAYTSQLGVIFRQHLGAGGIREAIDTAMSAYSKEVGNGRNAERFWRIAS